MVSNGGEGGPKRSRSVERAFTVLRAVAASPHPTGVTELAETTGLAKSTVHLCLQSLRHVGFVVQESGTDRYLLGLQAAQLGVSALEASPVAAALAPGMEALARRSGEAVSLGIRADRTVVFVRRFESAHRLRTNITVGSRMPLHASASGKCLLSGLSDAEIRELYPDEELPEAAANTIRVRSELLEEIAAVRERGYACNTDEWLDGVSAIAVPVVTGCEVVASLSIAGPTTRFSAENWVDDLRALLEPPSALTQIDLEPSVDGNRVAEVQS